MVNTETMFEAKKLFQEGKNISEIAVLLGHDRKTIRKLIQSDGIPMYGPRKPAPSRILPFQEYLLQRIQAGILNASKLFTEIKRMGFSGTDRLVRKFVEPYRPKKVPEVLVRFETPPGQQAQVDWAAFGAVDWYGKLRKLSLFVYTLGYSRYMFIAWTLKQDLPAFLSCHLKAFEYTGGVPEEILYDNLKSVVLERDASGIRFNPKFADFAGYYGFVPRLCRPYRAKTKGKTECNVRKTTLLFRMRRSL